MVISDTSYMIDGFTIALLAVEFGQVWAEHVCRDVIAEVKCKIQLNTLDNRPWKQNYIQLCSPWGYKISYDFRGDRTTAQLYSCRRRIWVSLDKARIKESHTTLGEIVGLHNCAVADITPQRERMITYDVT